MLRKKVYKQAKKYTMFRPRIRSRHPTHSVLRSGVIELMPFRSIVRLGSTTELKSNLDARVECNSADSIRVASNKRLMKQAFYEKEVNTPMWWYFDKNNDDLDNKNDEG